MDSNIRISSGVKTQLLQMLYEFLGFRVSGEYAPSAFQNWYSQIDTFIKEIPLKHRSKKNKTEYSMIIDNYWGIVHYKTTKLNNRLIFIIEKFDFDYPNLFNWLQNHEYPTQLSAPPLKWFKKKLEPIAHKYHIIKVYKQEKYNILDNDGNIVLDEWLNAIIPIPSNKIFKVKSANNKTAIAKVNINGFYGLLLDNGVIIKSDHLWENLKTSHLNSCDEYVRMLLEKYYNHWHSLFRM